LNYAADREQAGHSNHENTATGQRIHRNIPDGAEYASYSPAFENAMQYFHRKTL
jgi:hypothetical protein